tara:strand:- start:4426 stop:5688 length:1263 start_codon:yes stop_codon:yes gene_type:complete
MIDKLKGFNLENLVWYLVVPYVLVDALSGFFVQQIGINLRLSQGLKVIIYLLFMSYILKNNRHVFFSLTCFLFLFLINPIAMVFTGNSINAISFDFPALLRINIIVTATAFCIILAHKKPFFFQKKVRLTFYFSFIIVCINVLSGYFGVGFFSYPSEKFGFKGFFFAGNELSALFILLSSFVLFNIWKIRGFSFKYVIASCLSLVVGLSIGTKAGAIFSFVSPVFIPLAISISKITYSKALFRIIMGILTIVILALVLFSFIKESPMFERITYIFQTKGILGVIFSDRNIFVEDFIDRIDDTLGFYPLLFGAGSGVTQYQFKTIEVDFFDVAMYFGFPLAILCMLLSLVSIIAPLILLRKRPYAPLVLIVNIFLFFLASIAGHVWTSGMLGVAWGALNGLLFVRFSSLYMSRSEALYKYR